LPAITTGASMKPSDPPSCCRNNCRCWLGFPLTNSDIIPWTCQAVKFTFQPSLRPPGLAPLNAATWGSILGGGFLVKSPTDSACSGCHCEGAAADEAISYSRVGDCFVGCGPLLRDLVLSLRA